MRSIILNREFQHPADGWYQIEVPGEHPNAEAGIVQVIDAKAVASIVARFNQEADDYEAEQGRPFPGMLIDHEHFRHDADKETVAYGWLMRLQDRNGVPFGQIAWTNTGQPAIDGGDYRFFSTEYDPNDCEVLNPGKSPKRVRPLRLDGLSLTNDPNNKGGMAITNRDSSSSAMLGDETAELSLPALEKWFLAVKNIQDIAGRNARVAMDFNAAWAMARQQYPEIYNAAFGQVKTAAMAEASAVEQVGMLANRIKAECGKDFSFGWNFVRENLPHIFNRTLSAAERISNRQAETDPQIIRQKAARLFNDLATAEAATQKTTFIQGWNSVLNRRPALAGLAAGKLTLDEACAQEPELRNNLAT